MITSKDPWWPCVLARFNTGYQATAMSCDIAKVCASSLDCQCHTPRLRNPARQRGGLLHPKVAKERKIRLRNALGDGARGGVMGFQPRPKIGQPSPFSNPHM